MRLSRGQDYLWIFLSYEIPNLRWALCHIPSTGRTNKYHFLCTFPLHVKWTIYSSHSGMGGHTWYLSRPETVSNVSYVQSRREGNVYTIMPLSNKGPVLMITRNCLFFRLAYSLSCQLLNSRWRPLVNLRSVAIQSSYQCGCNRNYSGCQFRTAVSWGFLIHLAQSWVCSCIYGRDTNFELLSIRVANQINTSSSISAFCVMY